MFEPDILRWAAKRAAEQPSLLGYELREYRALNNATDSDLADALGCSQESLVCLALCRRPNPSTPSFRADVEQIALHCGVNAQKLAGLLREVDSLRAIRQTPFPPPLAASQSGLLVAARDRKPNRRPQKRSGKRRSGK